VTIARLLHRAAAMLVAILAVLTLLLSLMREVRNRINVTLAMCVLASTVMLAAVGRMSATLLVPATGIANLLGGFGMLACFWILWLHNASRGFATTADRARKRRQRVAGCTLLLCIVQAAAGALISVSYSATLCSSLWICDGGDGLRMPSLLAAQPVDAGGKVIATPAWGGVQALHRIGGVVTAALIAWFGVWVAQSGIHRALGFGLLGLAFAEAGIGILMATHDFPVLAAMAHNAVAALLLLMLVTLAWPRFAVGREASD
jgi:cytochrome c oxidase assembly protein subunit 15